MENRIRMWYDDSIDDVVFKISQGLYEYGLTIDAIDEVQDGFVEYVIKPIEK